jgi:membrane-bound lytic murein transglycosylase D
MKKLSVISTLTLSGLLSISCTQMKSQMKTQPSRELSSLMETVQIKDEDIFEKAPATGEYTHEMAEANADDTDIKKEVGVAEIDEELPGSEEDKIPYSRNFLAQKNTKRMQFWVDYFTKKNRERFQRFINNGEEYRSIIEQTFEEHGLPKELYYVGLIESGYYLGAKSHASAVGPWQFIKGTGKRYGLKINSEIDERQDLFKASKAAAMYFKDLHNVFSSWELALSAYNAGENGIIRRIMKYGTRDFYELSRNKQLPSETINYVPKVLAAMHVIKNAKKYGFVLPKKNVRLFDLTELKPIKKNVSLSVIARRLNVETALLKKLNPELKRNHTPRRFSGTYYLRVPKSKYSYRLEEVAGKEVTFEKPETKKEVIRRTAKIETNESIKVPKIYRVRRGDTLISISRKFKTTPLALAEANGFRSWRTRVKIGQRLKLSGIAEAKIESKTAESDVKIINRPIVYKVRRGDNLTDIARVFDLKISKIKRANNLKRGNIQIGQKIVLPDTKKGIYIVKKGDHLTKVAREFNQDLTALIKLNRLKRGTIYPGQKIIVNMD